MKKIITDEEELRVLCDAIDVRTKNKLIQGIVTELKMVIKDQNLLGLSAPQIGFDYRIFVINYNGDLRTYINPAITDAQGFSLSRETDPSIPGKEFIRPRQAKLDIAYQTPTGKIEYGNLVGKSAEVFQQLLDHLDGLLLTDVSLEVPEDFDDAPDEEKAELIGEYLESLDLKRKDLLEEIEQNTELNALSKLINLEEKLVQGDITITQIEDAKEEMKK